MLKHHKFRLYYPNFNETLTPDTLCAGTDFNGASYNSDWGTPLMVSDANGVWFQTGIFSIYFSSIFSNILAQRKLVPVVKRSLMIHFKIFQMQALQYKKIPALSNAFEK